MNKQNVVLQQIVACYQFPPCKWCNHLKNWLLFLASPTVDEKLVSNKKWLRKDSYAKFPCFNRNKLKDFRSYVRALSQGAWDFFTKLLPGSRVICRNNMASALKKYLRLERGIQSGLWLVKIFIWSEKSEKSTSGSNRIPIRRLSKIIGLLVLNSHFNLILKPRCSNKVVQVIL